MIKQIHLDKSLALLASITIVAAGLVMYFGMTDGLTDVSSSGVFNPTQTFSTLKPFASVAEFKSYLEQSQRLTSENYSFGRGMAEDIGLVPQAGIESSTKELGATEVSRVSGTNVQVKGVDEPDIVKTDGTNIYFSSEQTYYYGDDVILRETADEEVGETEIEPEKSVPPSENTNVTRLLKAFPLDQLAQTGTISETGELLLVNDVLVVTGYNKITGYDIADPANPKSLWKLDLNDQLVSARLFNNKLYLVTSTYPDYDTPCPLKVMELDSQEISLPCNRIYHPTVELPIDSTYTAVILEPKTGKAEKTISFVGSADSTVVYMSPNALYVAYAFAEDYSTFYFGFITTAAADLFPADIKEKINKLKDYDISNQSKLTEIGQLISNYLAKLDDDDSLKFENELQKRMDSYFSKHKRELARTGLVKISAQNLELAETGEIPGRLLNQFSIDEYEDNLRLATTSSGSWFGASSQSANDVYVLDNKLKKIGEVTDLGLTEQIYSVRFVGKRGYVVTFRQVDPFYVLDLSNPKAPKKTGELKIPGYSSYLDPLTENVILGVGQDDWKVKLTLFDVSNPNEPKELDTYPMDEGWSEAQSNHHAFLHDAKHEVFFLPGGEGGYVFSYDSNKLELKKAVKDFQMKRALYINDYLYLLSASKVMVLNETDWATAKELELPKINAST